MITGSASLRMLAMHPTRAQKIVDALESSAGVIMPVGWITDGASIPRAFWRLVGHPFEGYFVRPAGIHDVRCELRVGSWRATHDELREHLIAEGVERWRADAMWAAVMVGGPKWPFARSLSIDDARAICTAPTGPNGLPWGIY